MKQRRPEVPLRSIVGLLLALVFLAVSGPVPLAASLDPERRIDQYIVKTWSRADGLPHSTIKAIVQTQDGYLWLGTAGGLARFDGAHFTVFGPEETPALRVASIKALLESNDGALWAGVYGGGLVRYLDGQFTAFGIEAGLPSLLVRALAKTADGKIWVGTEDGGAALFDGERVVEQLRKSDGLPSDFVRALLFSRSGDRWIGTDSGGLTRSRDGELTNWTQAEGLLGNTVTDLLEDRAGNVWIATSLGLNRWNGEQMVAFGPEQGLASDNILSLHEDREGTLWVGTTGDGLSRYTDGSFSTLGGVDGLPDPFVWDILEDSEDNLWVATEGGLCRVRSGPFVMWSSRHGLADDQVRGIRQALDGSLLLGTPHGLDRLSQGKVTHLAPQLGTPEVYVWSVLETKAGDLWLSTDGGVVRIHAGQVTTYTAESGLGADLAWSLAEDPQGAVWAGTNQGGLARFAGDRWTRWTQDEGLGTNVVRSVLVDRAGDVWAATIGGGLSRLRDDKITTFTTADGLGSDTVLALFEDADANLWVGTQGGGLSVRPSERQDERFLTLPANGFVPATIGSIVEDDLGFFWMASDRGLRRAERSELLAVARGERSSAYSRVMAEADGLFGAAGAGFTPASWKARDGRLWFATTEGAATVDPRRLDLEAPPPLLVIESLLANHEPVDLFKPVVLPPQTFDIELHYTAPTFRAPDQVRFRYRLEGFDLDWVDVGERRIAYYTNLPPGRFRFEVTAANGDGAWNPVGANLNLQVLPHFYQTWLFKALLVAAALLALYGLHRLRAGRLELRAAVAEERNRLAREIHDTIAQDLASILIQSRVATRQATTNPAAAKERLERITALATGSLAEARSSLLALRSPALEGKDLATALAHTARLLAPDDEPVIDVHSVGDEALAPTVEVELLRIAKEAMTNAIRHSGAHRIKVDLILAAGEATLRVADDGRGFDPDTATRVGGFGLLGMRERVAALGGTLAILSSPGSGTSIEACVPAAGLAH